MNHFIYKRHVLTLWYQRFREELGRCPLWDAHVWQSVSGVPARVNRACTAGLDRRSKADFGRALNARGNSILWIRTNTLVSRVQRVPHALMEHSRPATLLIWPFLAIIIATSSRQSGGG